MGFFTDFFNAISNVSQGRGTDFGRNTGAAIQGMADSMRFSEPTRVDSFLLGPGRSPDPNRDYFAEGVAANKAAMEAMADMRDPMGERTDPNTGRSVREERGYKDKSTGSITRSAGSGGSGGGSAKTSGTTTELKPPVAPATIAEEPASSGELEDEAMESGKKGRKGTILTSSQGLLSDAPVRERRKLKGLIS